MEWNRPYPPAAMLDLETLGTTPRAASWSIGMVLFDPYGESPLEPRSPYGEDHGIGNFYRNLTITDQTRRGMTIEEGTLRWWMGRPDEERQAVLHNPEPISAELALIQMESFVKSNKVRHVWAHGVDFDVAILNTLWYAFFKPEKKMPWFFSNTEHTRSVYRLAFQDGRPPCMPKEPAHHALLDSWNQARGVQESLRVMHTRGIYWPLIPEAAALAD